MFTTRHRTALSGCILLACMAAMPHAQAQVTYDFRNATVASGPAGQIGSHVLRSEVTEGGNSYYFLSLSASKWQVGAGCQYHDCADNIGGTVQATDDGSLFLDLKSTPVGDVKGYDWNPRSSSIYLTDRKAFIQVNAELYTALVDPANTSFAFTFSGYSANAGQGVQIGLRLYAPDSARTMLFSQTATSNDAGNWQMVINTPVGVNLRGFDPQFIISADSGVNTLSSLIITPQLVAVPEPSNFALMGLGLIAWAGLGRVGKRNRRHH